MRHPVQQIVYKFCIHLPKQNFRAEYQLINQSKHISIAPYVASESEAHVKMGARDP